MESFPKFWPSGSSWQGHAKRGDLVVVYGHLYEIIHEPSAIRLIAFDAEAAKNQPYIVTSEAYVNKEVTY